MKLKLLELNIKSLKVIGLWPEGVRNVIEMIYTFSVIFIQILNSFSAITNFIQCNGQLNCFLENATYTILTLTGIYVFFVYFFNEELFKKAVLNLHDLVERFETYKYTIPAEKFTRNFCICFTIYCTAGLLQYIISPLVDYKGCLKRNNEGSALTCGLPTPGTFPFDSVTSPGYEVAFIFQCLCATLCTKSIIQPIMLCCSIVYHIIAQLNVLQDNIKKVCEGTLRGHCDVLRKCVEHHSAIINFTNVIAEVLNQLMLMHAVLLALILSVLGFQIMQMFVTVLDLWNLSRYISLLFGWLLMLLCLSILGQKLIDESTAVADCAYNLPWYDESVEFKKMIQLIILRANRPLVLPSASISELSFPSFAKVMSSTYSYLALLYKMLLADEDD